MSSYLTGKNGTATLNGTELSVTGWNVNPSSDLQDFRNSKTGNHSQISPTFDEGGLISIDYDITPTDNPYVAPLSLRPGANITNVRLYIDGSGGSLYWQFPSIYVQSMPQSVSVPGRIVNRIVARVDGAYAPPGQSVA